MTREQLAREIYRLDEKKAPHKTSEDEYVKRCLKGVGAAKPFLKAELEQMYQTRLERQEKENQEEKENSLKKIKNYLEQKITYSWYVNAKIDYGIIGKFIDAEIIGNDLKIVWEEMGKKLQVIISWFNQYSFEQLYYIWQETEWLKVGESKNITKKSKNKKITKRERIMQYVKKQVNVDLSIVRTNFTKKFERRNEIIVEFRELSKEDWRKVEMLAANKKIIRIEDVGVWGKMIALST